MATRSTRKRKPPPEKSQDETEESKATLEATDTQETSTKRRKVKSKKESSASSSPAPAESSGEDRKSESSQSETASSPVSKPVSSKEDIQTIVSWNVNGVRAWTKNGAWKYIPEQKPDIICLQEVKCSLKDFPHELKLNKEYTHYVYCPTEQKGYSGTAILSRFKPIAVTYGIGIAEHDKEGRVITAEYERLYLVTAYIPNSKRGLLRLPYRQEWDSAFNKFLSELDKKKPVILCGDLNVAHEEIDLANPAAGIGENGIGNRDAICNGLEYLGTRIDSERNNVRGKEQEISAEGSKVKIFVIPTNEEIMIARDTQRITAALKK